MPPHGAPPLPHHTVPAPRAFAAFPPLFFKRDNRSAGTAQFLLRAQPWPHLRLAPSTFPRRTSFEAGTRSAKPLLPTNHTQPTRKNPVAPQIKLAISPCHALLPGHQSALISRIQRPTKTPPRSATGYRAKRGAGVCSECRVLSWALARYSARPHAGAPRHNETARQRRTTTGRRQYPPGRQRSPTG